MRSLVKLAAVSVGMASVLLSVPAQAAATWTYNGSKVMLEENGQKRRITFVEPKGGLDKAGVKRGTVLFEGELKNGRLSGYAKLFKAGCDPLDYFVEGTVDGSKGEMVLQGQAPVFSGNDCKIKGYSEDSPASTLTFSNTGGGRPSYAGRDGNVEQGDGGYANRDPLPDTRNPQQGSASRQQPGYADPQSADRRYDDQRYGSGAGQYGNNSQRDPRQGSTSRYDDQQYGSNAPRDNGQYGRDTQPDNRQYGNNSQYDRRPDDRQYDNRQYDNRDTPRSSRDYADRSYTRNDYDPRNDPDPYAQSGDPEDPAVEEETRTYRYREYRRPYQPSWRDEGVGR